MKVIILAGGYGTRFLEETLLKPKPMIEIGCKPILWHIMKIYSHYGFNEFIIAGGYKLEIIKDYFLNYHYINNDFCIDLSNGDINIYDTNKEKWKIHIINTGIDTQTAGRIKKLKNYISNEQFMLTYGDGIADININNLISFHNKNNKIATISAVKAPSRYGELNLKNNLIQDFIEKPEETKNWINGGFMIFEAKIFDYIKSSNDVLEIDIMKKLIEDNELIAYKHRGFWHSMDTIRERNFLENLWENNKAYWKIWND